MNIEATKLELMHLLLQTQKESLLSKIKKIFDEEQNDWWNDITKEEQQDIELGLQQADKKDFTFNEDVLKRFDKWH
ncbi:MAG: hypothetical protein IMY67_07785 [Bacteroidetes bacterium]|nr:hypothetical protein [Bacteroidota bacterium]